MTQLNNIDAVPGIASPGFFSPGNLGHPGQDTESFQYIGHLILQYLDYVDTLTARTLQANPGGSYGMLPSSSRAGLSDPPPDGRWGTPSAPSYDIAIDTGNEVARVMSVMLADARALNAALQAEMAQGGKIPAGRR